MGCGLGHVSAFIQQRISGLSISGCDISPTAIKKAQSLYKDINFRVGDICSPQFRNGVFDCIVMSQILWYVLKDLPQVFMNLNNSLKKNGYLIFQMGFLKEQKYGRDIIDGYDGLIRYIVNNYFGIFSIVKSELDITNDFIPSDGIICCKKIA